MKKSKFKNNFCSPMSFTAWCDSNSEGDSSKCYDFCPNPNCKCQKQITLTPN